MDFSESTISYSAESSDSLFTFGHMAPVRCGSVPVGLGQREDGVGGGGVVHEEGCTRTQVMRFVLVQGVGLPEAF